MKSKQERTIMYPHKWNKSEFWLTQVLKIVSAYCL